MGKLFKFIRIVMLFAIPACASRGIPPEEGQSVSPTGVVSGAVSPFTKYCDGYGNNGASGNGYISVLTLGVGVVTSDMDPGLEGIVAYDRAETNDTYIGQINMITASSFNGLNGLVWGYHLAKSDKLADGTAKPIFERQRKDGGKLLVYSADPLLDAGARLFGTNNQRRYPMLPGAHVICATKDISVKGPCIIWSAIAIAIAEDREKDSNLFIEDCGSCPAFESDAKRTEYFDKLVRNIVECVLRCGEDNNAKYKEVFIGYKSTWVSEGQTGCALVAAPYVVLAKDAIPSGGVSKLLDMTISQWETDRKLKPLPAAQEKGKTK
jgi:histidine decarboxylase